MISRDRSTKQWAVIGLVALSLMGCGDTSASKSPTQKDIIAEQRGGDDYADPVNVVEPCDSPNIIDEYTRIEDLDLPRSRPLRIAFDVVPGSVEDLVDENNNSYQVSDDKRTGEIVVQGPSFRGPASISHSEDCLIVWYSTYDAATQTTHMICVNSITDPPNYSYVVTPDDGEPISVPLLPAS